MDTFDESNPFESPSEAITREVSLESVLRRARLGWQFPLIGVLLMAAYIASKALLMFATSLGVLLLIATAVCFLGGLLFTAYGIVQARSYPTTIHAIAGSIANAAFLSLIMIGLFILLSIPSMA